MLNWKLQSIRQEDWLKKEIHNKDLFRTLPNIHDGTFSENANAATCSVKNGVLKISQNTQENTCVRAFCLIKLQASGLQIY